MADTLRLTFETHATTLDNEAGVATGWWPGELSARGREEARELGRRHRDVSVVHASDLGRARETAALAFAGRGVPLVTDARLRECDYGRLTGAPRTLIDEVRGNHLHRPFPGGESYSDVVARVRSLLLDVVSHQTPAHVLLIGHAATRSSLEHLLAGVDLHTAVCAPPEWQPGWTFSLTTSSVPAHDARCAPRCLP